jgi:hypothetical protein
MDDQDRDESARRTPEDGDAGPDTGEESNPGEVQTYERAREVRDEPDATEGVPVGAGGPAEERGDRIPPAQAGDESQRGEPLGSATGQRTAATFDEAGERVSEPDQPLEEAKTAGEVGGLPPSVGLTHEAEGLTTLEEAVEEEVPQEAGQGRFAELMDKRKRIGLTDKEAEELGRLVAEAEGQSHTSAQSSRGEEDSAAQA